MKTTGIIESLSVLALSCRMVDSRLQLSIGRSSFSSNNRSSSSRFPSFGSSFFGSSFSNNNNDGDDNDGDDIDTSNGFGTFNSDNFGSFKIPPPNPSPPPPPPVDTSTKTGIALAKTYYKKFVVSGSLEKVCIDTDEFCNVKAYGQAAFISCYAAREAISLLQAGFAFTGKLRVDTQNGDIREINLETNALASALALSFTSTGTESESKASLQIESLSETQTTASSGKGKHDDTQTSTVNAAAAALGASESDSKSKSIALAESLGETSSTSQSFTTVKVKGTKITSLEGSIVSSATGFVLTESVASSLTESASDAFVEAISLAQQDSFLVDGGYVSEEILDVQFQAASALAKSFGEAVAKSVGKVGIEFRVDVSVTHDDATGVKLDFVGGKTGGSANVQCT